MLYRDSVIVVECKGGQEVCFCRPDWEKFKAASPVFKSLVEGHPDMQEMEEDFKVFATFEISKECVVFMKAAILSGDGTFGRYSAHLKDDTFKGQLLELTMSADVLGGFACVDTALSDLLKRTKGEEMRRQIRTTCPVDVDNDLYEWRSLLLTSSSEPEVIAEIKDLGGVGFCIASTVRVEGIAKGCVVHLRRRMKLTPRKRDREI